MSQQNDLFLLMFALSQMEDKRKITKLFCESVSELFHPYTFTFSEKEPPHKTAYSEKIITGNMTYGYLFCEQEPPRETLVSVQNAIQVLSVILDRLRVEEELERKARSFQSIAQKRLDAIKANVEELENSRKEAQNLIEDLKKEIVRREKIENELRESEEKFRLSFHTSPDSVNINRLEDGLYIEINQGFTDIMGYTADEIIGKTSYETNIWADTKDREKLVQGLKENGKYDNLEAKYRTKDDRIIEGLMSASLINLNGVPHIISITRDISEIKKAQTELQQNELLFRKAFENSASGMSLVSLKGEFLQINSKMCDILGYQPVELLHNSYSMVIPPEDVAFQRKRIEKMITEHTDSFNLEKRFLRKNGEIIWAEVSTSLILDSGENPLYIITNMVDIDERKKAEEELKDLARFPSENPNAVLRVDHDGIIIHANPESNLLLKTWKSSVGQPVPEDIKKKIDISFKKGKNTAIEVPCGQAILECILAPVTDRNYTNIYGSDITDSKKAEDTIKRERDQAQRYLDIAGVMLASLNPKGEIVIINKKGCEILGYDNADELIGKNWLDVCLPEATKAEIKNIFHEQMAGNIKTYEYYENPVITRSGKERLIAFYNTVLADAQGNITGVLFSGEDITERVMAEEEIRILNAELEKRVADRTAELEKANKELEEVNDVFVGREMRIIELKEEVKSLKNKLKEK